jgi:5-methylcytosine-specific restriction endonuclease McrBC regulatory subunit McrC
MPSIREIAENLPNATRSGSDFVLKLRENDDSAPFMTFTSGAQGASRFSAIRASLSTLIDAKLISVTLVPRLSDLTVSATIGPGENCGFGSVRDGTARLFIEVAPKIAGANLFALLALAGNAREHFLPLRTELAARPAESLLDLLVEAYLTALKRLLGRAGLRGMHEQVERVLRFKVRGHVDLPAYLREVAAGRPHHIPCTHSTLTIDNAVNRLLRWALHLLLRAIPSATPAAVELDRLDTIFGSVTLTRVTRGELSRISRLPEAFSQYRASGALPLATFIVESLSLAPSPGGVSSSSVSFAAHSVFEQAFAAEVARQSGASLSLIRQLEWPIHAETEAGQTAAGLFKPDVVLPPDDDLAGLIADTKWKTAMDRGAQPGAGPETLAAVVFDAAGIGLCNADIFQVLAYAQAAREIYGGRKFIGALVYPVANVPPDDLKPLRISVDASGESHGLPLYLLPWDVGRDCMTNSAVAWAHLQRLRGADAITDVAA